MKPKRIIINQPSGHEKRMKKAQKEEQLKHLKGSLDKYCVLVPDDLKTPLVEKQPSSSTSFQNAEIWENKVDFVNIEDIVQNEDIAEKQLSTTFKNSELENIKLDLVNNVNLVDPENNVQNVEPSSSCVIESSFITNSIEGAKSDFIALTNTTDDSVIIEEDPAKWDNLTELSKEHFIKNPPKQNMQLLRFTERKIGNNKRLLTKNNFYRKMKNGEKLKREWLVLSPSNHSVYCYVCKLFSNCISALATTGFQDWKHISERLAEHENSISHRQAVCILASRMKASQRIDSQLVLQYEKECKYWQTVLTRVVAVIKFLAKRGLPFFGDNETIGSQHNGNFLGCLELLSEFDPFLAKHLENFGNPGKGNVNYLSSTIINEFVTLMAKKVFGKIINEVQQSKYFSIIMDSTPDLSHVDQLSFVVRYVDTSLRPVERFLTFIPIESHSAEYLAELALSTLENYNLNVMNIRGQSYDNARNMSGRYSGLQTRIKEINPLAEYIPCSAHTLNLVAMHSVESCSEVTAFFSLLQQIYNFFSASTHRWNLLKNECLKKSLTLKSHSSTRWCADAEATKSLRKNYAEIIGVLTTLSQNSNESPLTRHEASSLLHKMHKMETAVNTVVWDTILQRLNKSSKTLQTVSESLESVLTIFNSLISFVQYVRDNFSTYEDEAKLLIENAEYQNVRKRKVPKSKFLDDGDTPPVDLSPRENFKVTCHYALCDALIMQLTSRKISYENVLQKFSFLLKYKKDDILKQAQALQHHYNNDLDEDFPEEYVQFLPVKQEEESILDTLQSLQNLNIRSTFPNVEIALRLFLTLPISNCTSERSFSLLKRLKSPLRSTMKDEKLSALAILSFESDITSDLDYSDIINEFSSQKSRKKTLDSYA